jgi:hypothetical protein
MYCIPLRADTRQPVKNPETCLDDLTLYWPEMDWVYINPLILMVIAKVCMNIA